MTRGAASALRSDEMGMEIEPEDGADWDKDDVVDATGFGKAVDEGQKMLPKGVAVLDIDCAPMPLKGVAKDELLTANAGVAVEADAKEEGCGAKVDDVKDTPGAIADWPNAEDPKKLMALGDEEENAFKGEEVPNDGENGADCSADAVAAKGAAPEAAAGG